MNLSCAEIATFALGLPARQSGAELFFCCPNHEDKHPSLQINQRKNVFLCGPCNKSGNAWRFAAFLSHSDPQDKRAVAGWLRERGLVKESSNGNGNGNGHHATDDAPPVEKKADFERVAEFNYAPDLRKVRFERPSIDGGKPEKTFRWEHKHGETWRSGAGDREKPLYQNRLFRETDKLGTVLCFEGEAKVDLAGQLGFSAFSFKNLTSAQCEILAGLDVIVWPDADAAGFKQCREAAQLMHESGQLGRLRTIVPPPELPVTGDIVDAVRTLGWGREQIERWWRNPERFHLKPSR